MSSSWRSGVWYDQKRGNKAVRSIRSLDHRFRKSNPSTLPPEPPVPELEPVPATAFFPAPAPAPAPELVVDFPSPTFPKANLVCPPLPAPPGTSAIFGFFVGGSATLSSGFFTCAVDDVGIVGDDKVAAESAGLVPSSSLSLSLSSRGTSAFGLGFCGEMTWIEEEDESRVAGAGRLSGFDMVLADSDSDDCDRRGL